jgi:hypothetical protein
LLDVLADGNANLDLIFVDEHDGDGIVAPRTAADPIPITSVRRDLDLEPERAQFVGNLQYDRITVGSSDEHRETAIVGVHGPRRRQTYRGHDRLASTIHRCSTSVRASAA